MPSQSKPSRISVVGLGKLGAPIAACLAVQGFEVYGVDTDPAKVEAINRMQPPIFEPGLAELLAQAGSRLLATLDLATAIHATDATMIIVPTPSDDTGGFSLRYILPVCKAIGLALREKSEFHTVVITSTVMPGATGGEIKQLLEHASGKICGRDFGLCYSPEFVALGSVIKDFLHPDFTLIGQSDPRAGDCLEAIAKQASRSNPQVFRTNFVNAELVKLSVNTYVTTKITFANMLAGICQQLPGADIDQVTHALGMDSRIGKKYLKGAVGYGGPCFPRDNRALASLARSVGADAHLAESTDRSNRMQVQRLADMVRFELPQGGTVAVLGLSYKPDTDVIEQSQGLLLAQALLDQGAHVAVFDPAAMGNAKLALNGPAYFADSLDDCLVRADVIVLVTPWKQFTTLNTDLLRRTGRLRTVIDCWRCLDAKAISAVARYVAVGIGPDDSAAAADGQHLRVA